MDLENSTLYIEHSLDAAIGNLKEPKTRAGRRSVIIDRDLIQNLLHWKALQAEYLFRNGSNFYRWRKSFRELYDFEGLRFHDLRHTHATMLVSSGLNTRAVSSRLGHSSVGITLNLYAHAQREDDEKAAAIIGQIMAGESIATQQTEAI